MNRRSRHLVVLAVAVVTAAIASFAVYRAILAAPSQAAERHQIVVVAARPMAIGTQLAAGDVKVLAWPGGSPIAGAIGDPKAVINRGLLTAVLENEPITANKVAAANEGAGLSPVIPRGMRALAVRVNDVIGVAGFVVPGSRVDLVVTMRQTKGSITRTAASNVQVPHGGDPAGSRKTRRRQEAKPVNRRHTDGDTRGRRANCAGAVRGRHHAGPAQSTRHRRDDIGRRENRVSAGQGGSASTGARRQGSRAEARACGSACSRGRASTAASQANS